MLLRSSRLFLFLYNHHISLISLIGNLVNTTLATQYPQFQNSIPANESFFKILPIFFLTDHPYLANLFHCIICLYFQYHYWNSFLPISKLLYHQLILKNVFSLIGLFNCCSYIFDFGVIFIFINCILVLSYIIRGAF